MLLDSTSGTLGLVGSEEDDEMGNGGLVQLKENRQLLHFYFFLR